MTLKNLKIAHRGIFNNKRIPENSLIAFQKAVNFNIPIELDVQFTKDHQLVVFHDINLKRMCGIDQYISDVTYQELRKYYLLSTKEKIPTLKEVLNLVQGKVLLDIEIKKDDNYMELCNRILDVLNNYPGEVLLKSFQPSIVKYLKKKTKKPVGLLITDYPPSKFYSYLLSSFFLIEYCHPNFLACNKKIIKKKRIQMYRKKIPIFVWTITNKEEIKEYKNYADSFLCNHLPYEK